MILNSRQLFRTAFLTAMATVVVQACTGISFAVKPQGENGSPYAYQARTMEFGTDVTGWRLIVVPAGYTYTGCRGGVCGLGAKGLTWKAKYRHVGMSPERAGLPILDEVADGMNEAGLSCGGFYHMGFEEYATNPRPEKTIANTDFTSWALSSFATVAELVDALALKKVDVAQFSLKCAPGVCPQLHYSVTDATGDAAVIEFKNGEPVVFKHAGVITNNPTYDWHLTNLRNYISLQAKSREHDKFNRVQYEKLGNGTGAVGLPGDFTPPSRFVRAMFFLSTAMPVDAHPDEAVARAFRILNQFDIPEGSITAPSPSDPNQTIQDATAWTSLSDLKRKRYYFHTQTNRTVRMIDLEKLPNTFLIQELPAQDVVVDITGGFTPPSK